MILLFRFIRVAVTSMFARRIDILGESVLELRVWPSDLDLNFHMNNGRYLSIGDLGRMDLLGRTGVLRIAIRRRWMPLIGGAQIRFRRSLAPFERFRLRSRVLCWDEKWVYIEHLFERNGDIAASARVRSLLRGPSGNISPSEVLATIGCTALSPPMPPEIQQWIAEP